MSNNSQFTISVLEILIEERITAHRKICNKGKQQQNFEVSDIVKSHMKLQSKSETGEVKKLSYQSRGLFQVKTVLGNN